MVWVAKTFKRWLNVGLVAASVVVLVGLIGGTIGMATTAGVCRNCGPALHSPDPGIA